MGTEVDLGCELSVRYYEQEYQRSVGINIKDAWAEVEAKATLEKANARALEGGNFVARFIGRWSIGMTEEPAMNRADRVIASARVAYMDRYSLDRARERDALRLLNSEM